MITREVSAAEEPQRKRLLAAVALAQLLALLIAATGVFSEALSHEVLPLNIPFTNLPLFVRLCGLLGTFLHYTMLL